MEKIEYQRLYEREKFYWWNIGRRRILESALRRNLAPGIQRRSILDVGCGAGGNALFLRNFGIVTGIDISEEALRFSGDKGFSKLILGSAEKLPFKGSFFDIVATLDVIEHVDKDTAALCEIRRVLKPDGIMLLTVPAHRWLWSRHDEALHHKRRYTRPLLRKQIKDAGFKILEMSHFVAPSIPFLVARKTIRAAKSLGGVKEDVDTYDVILPSFLNSALLMWLGFERFLMKFVSLPLGSSLLVVARKN